MNRLSKESSPYLRLHQYNPVDWYPWGPEALALAKKRNQPIFLSIGYSACHWCHVMAKESFSDPEIAKLMNEKFVCIKVDREERPDIDEIYMAAVQAMGQRGGWPLSVWLTPDARPFFGGTYFPPEDVGQRRGFRRVCTALANAWQNEKDEVVGNATALSKHLASSLAPALQPGEPDQAMLDKLLSQAAERFDPEHGGFAYPPQRAPKFPHSSELQVLLHIDDDSARDMVVTTLHAMRRGGIHDQLGGGFHRYSTDRQWLVPHFEKMLYDNALLASCYLEAAQATGEERFAAVGRSTLDYMLRELQAPSGGFWSSQDAQSDGVEGKFFVWQLAEVQQVLGDDSKLFVDVFGLREQGNWEGSNVLWLQNEAAAASVATKQQLRRSVTRLLAVREQRIKPATDDKVLAAWNGLALTALADGYRMLGDARYLQAARRCAAFCLQELVVDGRVWRSFHGGEARLLGYLDDHAALANGLLSLFEVDSNPRWLQAARDLLAVTTKHFRAADGAFWYTADDHEDLLARTKSAVEGAIPSGNAMAALAYLRAGLLLGDEATYQVGVGVLRAYHELLATSPAATPALLQAVQFHLGQPKEIVVAGEPDDARTQALLEVAWRRFPQAGVVTSLHAANREVLTKISGVFRDKLAVQGVPAAYVCERGTCLLPVTDAAKLHQVLAGKQ